VVTKELLAMTRLASIKSWVLLAGTLLLALLSPSVASAGWGDQNWGKMVWGGGGIPVPALTTKGLAALAVVLVYVSRTLLARRHRGARP